MDKYSIEYKDLSLGNHHFTFDVGDDIFAFYKESEVKKGEAKVDVDLCKHASFLEVKIAIIGKVEVVCDRCLDEFYIPVKFNGNIIVKFSENADELNEESGDGDIDTEIIWLHPSDNILNLKQYIYESITLSIPYSRTHPNDENGDSQCNIDMLSRFSISSSDDEDDIYDFDEDEDENEYDEDEYDEFDSIMNKYSK